MSTLLWSLAKENPWPGLALASLNLVVAPGTAAPHGSTVLLIDNTGPIARDVTDAAIALDVMAGEDPLDPKTIGSPAKAQPGPYTQYLKADALKGKRFGVPVIILDGAGIPFQGIPASESPAEVKKAFLVPTDS